MNVIGQCVLISVCGSVSFCKKVKVASYICVYQLNSCVSV